jgi:glycosyltransferase involved in cell wall biosynthesis
LVSRFAGIDEAARKGIRETNMHFSLVLATIGRERELYRLFDSLCAQTHQDFDTIIVDQNDDDRIDRLVAQYGGRLRLRHIRAPKGGHARANNVGLQYAGGELTGFPDDDCWYPADLLEQVERTFRERPDLGGISGREITGRWHRRAGCLNLMNLWKRHISFALFYRSSLIAGLRFDESLGIGAGTRWGSGEETDYLIRAMQRGSVWYDPALVVGHPQWAAAPYSEPIRTKARSYAVGMGHVLKMHSYPLYFMAWQCFRPLAGVTLALFRGNVPKAAFHLAILSGRAEGWLATTPAREHEPAGSKLLPKAQ